jgi:ABC-type lipoprotein export system ATPase subunit
LTSIERSRNPNNVIMPPGRHSKKSGTPPPTTTTITTTTPNNHNSRLRTAAPSDWDHTLILLQRNWDNDWNHRSGHRRSYCVRWLVGPLLWMLYTLSFLLSNNDNSGGSTSWVDVAVVNDRYRVYAGQELPLPRTLVLGARSFAWVEAVADELQIYLAAQPTSSGLVVRNNVNVQVLHNNNNNNNSTQFAEMACDGTVPPRQQVCVWLYSNNNHDSDDDTDDGDNYDSPAGMDIIFGGDESSVVDLVLAGTQQIVQQAVYQQQASTNTSTNTTTMFQPVHVTQIQRIPDRWERHNAPPSVLIFPGVMLVLASTIMLQFLMAPLSTDKFTDRIRSFRLVGVLWRVYLHSWLLYLSLNAIGTAAILTMVSVVWKLFPASSFVLIFLSHYLALIHLATVALVLTHLAPQEELTQGLPWLLSMVSSAVGIVLLVALEPDGSWCLSLWAVVTPFGGMLQYCAIYSNQDVQGTGMGIHVGDPSVVESGLLGCFLAQVVGILVWNAVLLLSIRPKQQPKRKQPTIVTTNSEATAQQRSADKFEPLPPNAQVLVRVHGLTHTYEPAFCQTSAKRVEVLKGLDLEICRGEVFGYLGHNASGKTTSIGILSGELDLQEGRVTYHFAEGEATVGEVDELHRIRQNIGVCLQHNDALHNDLSAREFLRLFAKLKGRIPQRPGQSKAEAIEAEVDRRLADIKFTSPEDADQPIETYSGGMKRKVCSKFCSESNSPQFWVCWSVRNLTGSCLPQTFVLKSHWLFWRTPKSSFSMNRAQVYFWLKE